MSDSNNREQIRLLGRRLEDVREHITIVKQEIALIEDLYEAALTEMANLVKGWDS